jgi:WD40 repeat protein
MSSRADASTVVVFVSYAREDAEFARRCEQMLAGAEIRVRGDWELERGDSYREQLRLMILSADVFLFVISPESVASEACREEVELAASLGKRLIPVSHRDHGADERVPAPLREPQWTFMRTEAEIADALEGLSVAVRTDFALAREHQRLSVAAENWRHRGATRTDLLRGDSLRHAEQWLAAAGANPRTLPKPSPLVSDFIVRSQANSRWEVRRNFALVGVLAVVLGGIAAYALYQRAVAEAQSRVAASRRLAAEAEGMRDTQPDLAGLLAAGGWQTDPTAAAHGALVSTSQFSPHLARFLHHHPAPARALAVSHSGSLIASGNEVGLLVLHDAVSGKELAQWTTDGAVSTVAFTRDGARLASGGTTGTAVLWDVASHREIWKASSAGSKPILAVAFSPDDTLLAVADISGSVRAFDVAAGAAVGPPMPAHASGTWAAVFVDAQVLATGGWDGTIAVWDVRTGREVRRRMTGHSAGVRALALSPDGKLLASAALDGTVALWNWSAAVRVGDPLRGHTGYVETVAFSPDGSLVASSGNDRTIRLWDVTRRTLATPPLLGHQETVWNLRFMPSGTGMATVSEDGKVILWDLATPNALARPMPFVGKGVGEIAVSTDGRWLAAADIGGNVEVWRCSEGMCGPPSVMKGHKDSVWRVAIDPRSDLVASAGVDRTVRLWNLADGSPRGAPLRGPSADIYGLAFSPDGETLAASDYDGSLYFWRWRDGAAARRLTTGHRVNTGAIAFAPDGGLLAVAADKEAVLVDPRALEVVARLSVPGALVKDLAFSPDSTRLAVAGTDKLIQLFDVQRRRAWGAPLVGHRTPISAIAFSGDGRTLAAGDDDGVIVWDLESRRPIGGMLVGHTATVGGVAFEPRSGRLITGDWDGRVLRWDLSPDGMTRLACGRAARPLSPGELEQYFDDVSTPPACGGASTTSWASGGPSRVLVKAVADSPSPDQAVTVSLLDILNQMVRDRAAANAARPTVR